MRRRGWLAFVAGIVLGAMLMLVGLAQAGRLAASRPEALVALGQLLETEHRRVDLMLERGDIGGAIEVLEDLRGQRWPSREEAGDAALVLRHDAYGRLVRLRLDHPDVDPVGPETLAAIVEEGMGASAEDLEPNPFTARVLALRGEVFELLERDDEALSAYEEALEMNRILLERELGGAP
jgi:hypothetical protein